MGLTRISAAAVTDTDFKTSCKVATSTNISSFTATPNSIDGYTFSVGDRVLVKAQDNPAQNGIYVVESVGTGSNGRWARAGDFRDAKGITNGAITFVERGIEANTFFFLGGLTSSVSIGSTALTFNSLVTETATTVIGSSQPNITSVGTLTSLAVAGNANVGNILAGGFYFSNGSPFTVDSTQILNGNSNIKVAANGNVSVSVAGNSNVIVITDTGANISGTANISGNANVGNLGTAQVLASANVTAPQLISNVSTGTAPLVVTSTTRVSNLNVANAGYADTAGSASTSTVTATVTSSSQPNITSVGTLVSLDVTGNANVGNLNTTGDIQIGGNDIRSSTGNVAITLSNQDVTVVGNLTVQGTRTEVGTQDLVVADSIINLHTQPNLAPLTVDDGRDVGIVFHYYKTSDKLAFLGWANDSSFLEYYSDGTESAGVFSGTYGSIKIANVLATGGVFYNGNSNLTVANSGNVTISSTGTANVLVVTATGANIAGTANITGNANVGNLGAATVVATNLTGTLTTAAQPNITSVGTLTSLNVSGNANVGNLGTAQVLASANVTSPQLISNVATGTAPLVVTSTTRVSNLNVANAGYADTAGAATSATTAGTVTTAAQPNITSVGTLSSLAVTGNANVGNILAGGFYYSNGSPFTVDSTQVVNGNSNVKVAANSNVTVSVAGNANVMTVTGTGANIAGYANITGNITAGNVLASGFYFANGTPYNRYTSSSSAPTSPTNGDLWYDSNDNVLYVRIGDGVFSAWLDISSSTDVFANITANNANITDNLTVGANANIGNLGTGTVIATTANLTTINSGLMQNGNSNVTIAANANVSVFVNGNATARAVFTSTGANIAGTLDVTGNANVGNIGTTTAIITTGNITTVNSGLVQNGNSNVTITANSNVSVFVGGNANARITATTTGANIIGTLDVTSNVTVSNITANGVSNLGAIANVRITGGSANQVIKTDGAGNLSFGNAGGATFTSSTTAPTSPSLGDYWYDTDTDVLYIRANDGTTNLWIDITTVPRVPAITSSSTAPSSPQAGDMWYDTATDIFYIRVNDGVDPFWLDVTSDPNSFGNIIVTGNANVGNLNLTGNIVDSAALTIQTGANGNITLNPNGTGVVVTTANLVPNANATLSLGTTALRYANIWGLASSAQYADLAEKYLADETYSPGTVVIFGGSAEITVTTLSHDSRVAGVISTEPAYLMNDNQHQGNLWLPVALTGRVPCKVQGPVRKGDILVSSGTAGVAEKLDKSQYEPGCVIGKSLENHTDNTIKTIEVVVGRF